MEAFRALPSVDRLLASGPGAALVEAHGRAAATGRETVALVFDLPAAP